MHEYYEAVVSFVFEWDVKIETMFIKWAIRDVEESVHERPRRVCS
jgi:hypothetical protein